MPIGTYPGVKETVELVNQYGLAMVFACIFVIFFLIIFTLMLRWVFRMAGKLADMVNIGLKQTNDLMSQNTNLCSSIREDIKGGFDMMRSADTKHKEDLKEILSAVKDGDGCKHPDH